MVRALRGELRASKAEKRAALAERLAAAAMKRLSDDQLLELKKEIGGETDDNDGGRPS
jgi:hypothetical protein